MFLLVDALHLWSVCFFTQKVATARDATRNFGVYPAYILVRRIKAEKSAANLKPGPSFCRSSTIGCSTPPNYEFLGFMMLTGNELVLLLAPDDSETA